MVVKKDRKIERTGKRAQKGGTVCGFGRTHMGQAGRSKSGVYEMKIKPDMLPLKECNDLHQS